jgi:hypothetical protein
VHGLLSQAKVESYRGFVFACFDPGAVDLRKSSAGLRKNRLNAAISAKKRDGCDPYHSE